MYSGSGWNHDWTAEKPENNNREEFLLLISILLSRKTVPKWFLTGPGDVIWKWKPEWSHLMVWKWSSLRRGPGLCYFWEDCCLLSLDGGIFIAWILATHSVQGRWTEVASGSWRANCFFSGTWISSQKGHSLLTCFSINFGPNSSYVLGAGAPPPTPTP